MASELPPTQTRGSQFIHGVKAILPILLAVAPFGMIYGALARQSGLSAAAAQSMSFFVFAGSSQFVTTQLVSQTIPGLVIVLTIFVVNLRHALYSASVAPYLQHLPAWWKAGLAYLLTDEAYAVTITHYNREGDTSNKHWYFFGAGLTLWTTWQVCTAIGIFIGAQIPPNWPLDFVLPLTFIALVVPAIKDRASMVSASSAALVGLLTIGFPFKTGLLVAAFVGILSGLLLEGRPK